MRLSESSPRFAYGSAKDLTATGYQPHRPIADNMANEQFRSVFKDIVRREYPDFFKEVDSLK